MMTVRSLSKSSLLGLLLLTGCICICIQVTAAAAPTPRFTVAKSKMAKELDHRTPHRHQLHLDAEQEEGTFTAHGLSHKASDIIRKDDDDNDNDEIMECQDEAASLLLLDKGDKDQEAQTSTASSSLLIARGGAGRGRGGLTEAEPSVSASVLERLKIGFYFALWYALNVVYK